VRSSNSCAAIVRALAALVAMALCDSAGAQRPDAPAGGLPPLGEPRPLALPAIVVQTLPDGLKLVLLEDHKQPALWLRLALPAGSIRDPVRQVGLAEMTAALLNKGTAERTATQIADLVDGIGASLDASAGDDFLTISAQGLSGYSDTLFSLLADVTLRPTFPMEELERTRTRVLNELNFSLAQPETMASAAIDRVVFGAHPYGNLATGTPKTLAAISVQDLRAFHDTYFAPNAATLFLVGDITPAQALQKATIAFRSWDRKDIQPAPAPPAPSAPRARPRITLIDRPGAAQTQIRIGALVPGYSDPNRIVGTVATIVLGAGNFEGRLIQEIREKRGLAYGASSVFRRHQQAGEFEISTFTKNVSTGEVIKIALDEARKIATVDVPADELSDRKTYLDGEFAISVATPDGVLARLVPAVLYGGGPGDLTTFSDKVAAVTPGQIRDVMSALNPGAPEIVLVGDAKAILDQVKPLGDVTVIPFDRVDLLAPTLQSTAVSSAPASEEEIAVGKTRLAAVIRAMGGEAFLNLKTLHLKGKGTVTAPGGQFNAKINVDAFDLMVVTPDRARLDLTTGFGLVTLGVPGNGKAPWLNTLGQVQDPPAEVANVIDLFNPAQLLGKALRQANTVRGLADTADGTLFTSVDGAALRGFGITDDRGATTDVYSDKATNLVRLIQVHTPRGAPIVVSLGDYHESGGVQVPRQLRADQGKVTLFEFTVNSFDVNQPVDDKLFARPQ